MDDKAPASLRKYIYFLVLFIVLSFLTLLFLYHMLSDKTSFISISIFSWGTLAAAFLMLGIHLLSDSLRLFYILKTLGTEIRFKNAVDLTFVNVFVSNVTPFATGGGFAQIYLMNRDGISLGDATAAATIRSVLPIMFFSTATPLILIFDNSIDRLLPIHHALTLAAILILVNIIAVIATVKLVRNPHIAKRAVYHVYNFLEKWHLTGKKKKKRLRYIFTEMDNFASSINRYGTGKKIHVFLSLFFSFTFLLSLFMISVILVKGLNGSVSALPLILSQVVVTVIMYFAPTPGATGAAEGSYAMMFSGFVDKSEIISLIFTWRFITIYVGFLIGMVLTYRTMLRGKR